MVLLPTVARPYATFFSLGPGSSIIIVGGRPLQPRGREAIIYIPPKWQLIPEAKDSFWLRRPGPVVVIVLLGLSFFSYFYGSYEICVILTTAAAAAPNRDPISKDDCLINYLFALS